MLPDLRPEAAPKACAVSVADTAKERTVTNGTIFCRSRFIYKCRHLERDEARRAPPNASAYGGFFHIGPHRQQSRQSANLGDLMPFSTFLARIREKIPVFQDEHYTRIAKGFQDGELHQPPQPMSDAELGRAIAAF